MVEYAACMREHGVDMPDPQVQSDGGDVSTGKGGMVFAMPLGADVRPMAWSMKRSKKQSTRRVRRSWKQCAERCRS